MQLSQQMKILHARANRACALALTAVLSGCGGGEDDSSGPLSLNDLSIASDGYSISPAFDPSIRRYALRVPDTLTNESEPSIALAVQARANTLVTIQGQSLSGDQTAQVRLPPAGESLEILVSTGSLDSTQYDLVVIPSDFPRIEVITRTDAVADGELYIATGSERSYVAAIDNNGVPAFFRFSDNRLQTFTRHPNGQYSYSERFETDVGLTTNWRVLLDQNYNEIGRLQTAPPLRQTDFHDFRILPNGNYVFLSYEPAIRDGVVYQDAVIQEVDPQSGVQVFQWNSWGQIPLADRLGQNETDYAHINSVSLDTDGNFLASLRATSQIIKINRSTGLVMWKLGGLSNQFVINDPLGGPCGQHHVSRLPSGNLLFFDNGVFCPDDYPQRETGARSRAVEYSVDEVNLVADLVWSHNPGTDAAVGGSAQRLENGNTLIGWGGRSTDHSATEVAPNGSVIFEMDIYRDDSIGGSNRVLRF